MTNLIEKLAQGKHATQDFIAGGNHSSKIAKILVSFANSNGGTLFIGVKDNGKIQGVNPDEELKEIQEIIKENCQPFIQFKSNVWKENMRLVLEIEVEPNFKRFVKAKDELGAWDYYIRQGDEVVLANKIQLKLWKLALQPLEKNVILTQKEQDCLNILATAEKELTISQIYKQLSDSKKQIDEVIARLIHWKFVRMEYKQGSFYYHFVPKD